ncbi:endolytic transglycosylase MltG [Comamonas serinivorans]|nr:endolytic transglycosylase MltG [Comamonas serinivorans]
MAACAAYLFWWLEQPLPLNKPNVQFSVPSGSSAQQVAERMHKAGVQTHPWLLYAWFRLSGESRQIKAGVYEVEQGDTPQRALERLVKGEQAVHRVTFIEGWTLAQARAALAKAPDLLPDSAAMSTDDLMKALDRPGVPAEGRFFPDTYTYPRGTSDLTVLRQALVRMDRQLDAAWSLRAANTPLKSADELLKLASIVEKETGRGSERPMVAAVFLNRLQVGMPLQTDPTVIYGMGATFQGNLRKKDLQTDTPYNSYTRTGLPPTPIALPGKDALIAVVQPARTKALYFVARGNGTSHFSDNLQDHNRAVNLYQRGQQSGPLPQEAASAPASSAQ